MNERLLSLIAQAQVTIHPPIGQELFKTDNNYLMDNNRFCNTTQLGCGMWGIIYGFHYLITGRAVGFFLIKV